MKTFAKKKAIALNRLAYSGALLAVMLFGGCAKEDEGIVNVCVPPTVIRTSPADGDADAPLNKTSAIMAMAAAPVKVISATFSTPMNPATLSAETFIMLQDADTIRGTVSYSDSTAYFMVPNGLIPNRTYTCKITTGARDPVGTSLVSDYVWSFSTLSPEAPTLESPADQARDQALNPILAWNALPGTETYRLQVSLSPAFVVMAYDDSTLTGTSRQLTDLSIGMTYYWRVNAKMKGVSGAYSPIWSFGTITSPAAPVLLAPLAAATNQPTTLALTWLPSPGAETYRLQISTSITFSGTMFHDSTVAGTVQLVTGLQAGTTYYWRVQAINEAGTSAYTSRSFRTVVSAPQPPALVAPEDAADDAATIQTLDWDASVGASTYRLQVDTSSAFASVVFDDSTLRESSRAVPGLKVGTTYYWRVNAKNPGGTSAYSKTWRFTVASVAILAAPMLVSPVDSATDVPVNPTLDWNASIGAATYRLQVDTTAGFADPIFNDSTLTATAQALTGLLAEKIHYWRVNAKNNEGTSVYSPVRSFTVSATPILPPPAPVLAAPSDLALDISTNPTLSWNASARAVTYRLQVDTSAAFSSSAVDIEFDDSTLTGLSRAMTGLIEGGKYFWRVNAKNNGGTSAYSQTRSFTVKAAFVDLVNMGAAQTFGTIGGSAGITNQGTLTQVIGNIGTTGASTLVTGFHDATLAPSNVFTETTLNIGNVHDTIYTATAPPGSVPGKVAADALAASQTAFDFIKGLPPGPDPLAGELGGLVLAPGTYTSAGGTFKITLVDLVLDAQGDSNAVFIFQMASALTVGAASGARTVHLINGAQAKNVFWVAGTGGSGAATINAAGGGTMVGTIIAYSGITFSTAGNVEITRLNGRALGLNASVTMVNTIITVPSP